MMYQEKMAFAIKANGKILREFGETVYIPFGSEYSILIKNLNSVRALVQIWVDGTCITEGVKLVVNANDSFELERFIKNGNMNAGNKLKFIEKTQQISDFRGDKIEDGLVRITYEFEKIQPNVQLLNQYQYLSPSHQNLNGGSFHNSTQLLYRCVSTAAATCSFQEQNAQSISNNNSADAFAATAISDAGITVEGAVSDQKFSYAASFQTDGMVKSMVIVLKGKTEQAVVAAPVTVDVKPICETCGKKNKAGQKFCGDCGTSLQIV